MTTERLREPWERMPDETDAAYRAFQIYLDQTPGDRSRFRAHLTYLEEYTERTTQPKHLPGRWVTWSRKWNWTERVRAWDDDVDRRVRARRRAELLEARRRHASLGTSLQNRAVAALQTLEPGEINAATIAQMAKAGVDMELRALGDHERVQVDIPPAVLVLPPEDPIPTKPEDDTPDEQ